MWYNSKKVSRDEMKVKNSYESRKRNIILKLTFMVGEVILENT